MADFNRHLLALSARIVAAHAGHNEVRTEALPAMIRNVYNTLAELGSDGATTSYEAVPPTSAHRHHGPAHDGHAPRRADNPYQHPVHGQTVFDDHLICMEDGLSMKMLKRHLLTVHGITPEEYRTKWGLPADYPMVAAQYAKLRSDLALQSGLGLKTDDRPSRARKARKA